MDKFTLPPEEEDELETKLRKVLDSDESPEQKKRDYLDILNQITVRDERVRDTEKLPIKNLPGKYNFNHVFESMGKQYTSKKGRTFLSYLYTLDNINWTPKGVVYLDGTKLVQSNIVDLVTDAVANATSVTQSRLFVLV